MTMSKMIIPAIRHIRIFMSFLNIKISKSALHDEDELGVCRCLQESFTLETRLDVQLARRLEQRAMIRESDLPPHLLANSVCPASEPLSRDCKIIGLILERIEAFTTLRDLVDVLSHHANGIVNLLRRYVS